MGRTFVVSVGSMRLLLLRIHTPVPNPFPLSTAHCPLPTPNAKPKPKPKPKPLPMPIPMPMPIPIPIPIPIPKPMPKPKPRSILMLIANHVQLVTPVAPGPQTSPNLLVLRWSPILQQKTEFCKIQERNMYWSQQRTRIRNEIDFVNSTKYNILPLGVAVGP